MKSGDLEEGMRPHRARSLWADVVGEPISTVTVAEKVRGRVLFVRTKSSVWANELTFYKPDILRKLNSLLGGSVLDDIHFQPGSRSARPKQAASAASAAPSEEDLVVETPQADDRDERVRATLDRAARARDWKRRQGWVSCNRCRALYEPAAAEKNRDNGLCPFCRMQGRSS
jgi:hypothetical protein